MHVCFQYDLFPSKSNNGNERKILISAWFQKLRSVTSTFLASCLYLLQLSNNHFQYQLCKEIITNLYCSTSVTFTIVFIILRETSSGLKVHKRVVDKLHQLKANARIFEILWTNALTCLLKAKNLPRIAITVLVSVNKCESISEKDYAFYLDKQQ